MTRKSTARAFWKIFNPLARPLAGFLPWWVLLETKGRRTGKRRRTPLANGPFDGNVALLIAVHGDSSRFAYNIAADPHVRLKRRGRWHAGTASLIEPDEDTLQRFSRYARSGIRTFGEDPRIIRIQFGNGETT
jgi:deazaflavin-dependent oxidoreductase (nitroreductase family)